jgi:hypothetical protein
LTVFRRSAGNDVRSAGRKRIGITRYRFHDFGTQRRRKKRKDRSWAIGTRVIDGWDIPFEFVGKISSSSSVAKTGDIECGPAARHLEGYR